MSVSFNQLPAPSSRAFGSNSHIFPPQKAKQEEEKTNTDTGKDEKTNIGTVAQTALNQIQKGEARRKLSAENVSTKQTEIAVAKTALNQTQNGVAQKSLSAEKAEIKIKITDAEFKEIFNPANLSKVEVEEFVNFLIKYLKRRRHPKSSTAAEKNAQELANSYLSREISLATLLKEEVTILDLVPHKESDKLRTLPKGMSLLRKLVTLKLGFNKLTDLPEELEHLKELRVIDLIENEFKSVPRVLYKDRMSKVIKIYLDGNYQIKMPHSLKKEICRPYPQGYEWIEE